jgi:hypothetical protein
MALYGFNPVTRAHILFYHRFGAGWNKSEFPQGWSDGDIIAAVETVANDPASSSTPTGVGRLKVKGNRNNLAIVVIVEIFSGVIVSGWPGH